MEKDSIIRILLVDDHAIVRKGLASMIDEQENLTVCAQAGSHDEAMAALQEHDIDIAIVDLRLEEGSGLRLIAEMHSSAPHVAALVFSMHEDTHFAERAVRAGARGYVMKQEPMNVLLDAIRRVREGEIFVRPELATRIARCVPADNEDTRKQTELDDLTDREIEVLQLMAEGLNRREIAAELGISVKTIEGYRENMKKKLYLRDTVQLAQFAARALGSENI